MAFRFSPATKSQALRSMFRICGAGGYTGAGWVAQRRANAAMLRFAMA